MKTTTIFFRRNAQGGLDYAGASRDPENIENAIALGLTCIELQNSYDDNELNITGVRELGSPKKVWTALKKVATMIDGGVHGSGYTICRGCYGCIGDHHSKDCWMEAALIEAGLTAKGNPIIEFKE